MVKVFGDQSPASHVDQGRDRARPRRRRGARGGRRVVVVPAPPQIPPTANTVDRVDLGIDVVISGPRPLEPGPTLSNNFGFGGHNGSVILTPA